MPVTRLQKFKNPDPSRNVYKAHESRVGGGLICSKCMDLSADTLKSCEMVQNEEKT